VPILISGTVPAWLSLSHTSLETPTTVTLTANPAGLAPGTYSTSLNVSSSYTVNGSVQVAVTFTVQQSARIHRNAHGISLKSIRYTTPSPQIVEIAPSSGITSIQLSAGDVRWVSVTGSRQNNIWRFAITPTPIGLPNGVYDTELELVCAPRSCEPGTLPVRLEVQNTASTAGPRIASGGVVNAASFQPGISPGAWMSVFGANLGSRTRTWVAADFAGKRMPTSLDGVQVFVEGQPAAIHFVSPGQINFQATSTVRAGWVRVEVRSPFGVDSAYVYASRENPGFFQFDGVGNLAAIHPDGVPVGVSAQGASGAKRPARPGSTISIYGTGFGPTSPSVPSGETFSGSAPLVSRNALKVTIGGIDARIDYAGLTAAGLNQINVLVPTLPAGTYDVVATIDTIATQFQGKLVVGP
jgi:uncharacterized protein (TIGR03437 family)